LVRGELPWPLFLWGPAGVGKTSAALCLADYYGGLYFTVSELARTVIEAQQGRFSRKAEQGSVPVFEPDLWRWISSARLVILDEICSRSKASDHRYDCVFGVLDRRKAKPTVCIANVSAVGIDEIYDSRVVSRACCGTVFHLEDRDRRLEPRE